MQSTYDSLQTLVNDVLKQARASIDSALPCCHSVCNCRGEELATNDLADSLAREFEVTAAQWRRDKRRELVELAALLFLENAQRLTEPESAGLVAAETADGGELLRGTNGNGGHGMNGTTTFRVPGPGKPDSSTAAVAPFARPGVLELRALTSFLEASGFERVPHRTGKQVYRHAGGAKVSLPTKPVRQLRTGVARKILRRVGEILRAKLEVRSGEIVRREA